MAVIKAPNRDYNGQIGDVDARNPRASGWTTITVAFADVGKSLA